MAYELLSVAIYEPLPGQEEASLSTMRDLFAALSAGGYSRDVLYRDSNSQYVLLRYWKSEEARRAAQEDPEIQRCWARLGNEIRIVRIYEHLEQPEGFSAVEVSSGLSFTDSVENVGKWTGSRGRLPRTDIARRARLCMELNEVFPRLLTLMILAC